MSKTDGTNATVRGSECNDLLGPRHHRQNQRRKAMRCPECNAWTEVLETRGARRRRICANQHRFTTKEVVVTPPSIGPFRRGKGLTTATAKRAGRSLPRRWGSTTRGMEMSDRELLEALKYHQEQTRPIQRTIDAIAKVTGEQK